MQVKQFYNIATKVSGRKNATTFGDLADCSGNEGSTPKPRKESTSPYVVVTVFDGDYVA